MILIRRSPASRSLGVPASSATARITITDTDRQVICRRIARVESAAWAVCVAVVSWKPVVNRPCRASRRQSRSGPASCADPAVHGHSPASGPRTAYSDPARAGHARPRYQYLAATSPPASRVKQVSHADMPTRRRPTRWASLVLCVAASLSVF